MNILLQILDEGRITDAQGRTVNFENTVVVMTSNAGSGDKSGIVGFDKNEKEVSREKAMKGLSSFLRPEFLGRVDDVIVFNPLSIDNLKDIARLMLEEMRKPLLDLGLKLKFEDSALEVLAKKSADGKFAARDLRTTIRKEVEDKVSALVISTHKNKKEIYISSEGDEIIVSMI